MSFGFSVKHCTKLNLICFLNVFWINVLAMGPEVTDDTLEAENILNDLHLLVITVQCRLED